MERLTLKALRDGIARMKMMGVEPTVIHMSKKMFEDIMEEAEKQHLMKRDVNCPPMMASLYGLEVIVVDLPLVHPYISDMPIADD